MQMEPYSACRFGRRSLRAGGEAQTRRACPSCAKRGPLRRLPWSRGLRYNPIITARQGRVFPVVGGYQWIVTPLTSALKVFLGSYANLGHAVMSGRHVCWRSAKVTPKSVTRFRLGVQPNPNEIGGCRNRELFHQSRLHLHRLFQGETQLASYFDQRIAVDDQIEHAVLMRAQAANLVSCLPARRSCASLVLTRHYRVTPLCL